MNRRDFASLARSPDRVLALSFLVAVACLQPAAAQERHRKVPGIDKVTGGPSHLMFTGKVQSLDLDRSILNVNTVQGGNTEIFPVRKGVRVATADGEKLKLNALAPGTDVLVSYEQKGDRRVVKEIIVLTSGSGEAAKKPTPHSPHS